jgi:serine/threonine protein kinase
MQNKVMSRSIFIESIVGNIKEKYFFEKKLGSGGYGAVYLAKNKLTGKSYKKKITIQYRRKSCNKSNVKK